jgi:phosphatidate cytidylyltransferase
MLTDVSAYIIGKRFKGIKLAKFVSPNKTVSGFIGALVIPTLICLIVYFNSNEVHTIIFSSIFFSLIVQFGDLLESLLKRKCFVKESSKLIPGHGGLLDRLDGVFLLIIIVSFLNILDFNFFFIV